MTILRVASGSDQPSAAKPSLGLLWFALIFLNLSFSSFKFVTYQGYNSQSRIRVRAAKCSCRTITGLALDSFLVLDAFFVFFSFELSILCFLVFFALNLRPPTELQESEILSSVWLRCWVTDDLEWPIVYLPTILKTGSPNLFVCNLKLLSCGRTSSVHSLRLME